MLKPAG